MSATAMNTQTPMTPRAATTRLRSTCVQTRERGIRFANHTSSSWLEPARRREGAGDSELSPLRTAPAGLARARTWSGRPRPSAGSSRPLEAREGSDRKVRPVRRLLVSTRRRERLAGRPLGRVCRHLPRLRATRRVRFLHHWESARRFPPTMGMGPPVEAEGRAARNTSDSRA